MRHLGILPGRGGEDSGEAHDDKEFILAGYI